MDGRIRSLVIMPPPMMTTSMPERVLVMRFATGLGSAGSGAGLANDKFWPDHDVARGLRSGFGRSARQELEGPPNHFPGWLAQCGQRRDAHPRGRNIIDPGQRQISWHADSSLVQGPQRALGHDVICGDQGGWQQFPALTE